jgi:hypothetical protein
VPTYNEALNIVKLVTQLAQLLDEPFGESYEIIVVDDDSHRVIRRRQTRYFHCTSLDDPVQRQGQIRRMLQIGGESASGNGQRGAAHGKRNHIERPGVRHGPVRTSCLLSFGQRLM